MVVWKLDRAFRSVLDGVTTLQALRAAGCGLCSLQESWIGTTTPVGEAMYRTTLAWAQLEQRQLAERVRSCTRGLPSRKHQSPHPVSHHGHLGPVSSAAEERDGQHYHPLQPGADERALRDPEPAHRIPGVSLGGQHAG